MDAALISGCTGKTSQTNGVTSARVMINCQLDEGKHLLWVSADTDGRGAEEQFLMPGEKIEVIAGTTDMTTTECPAEKPGLMHNCETEGSVCWYDYKCCEKSFYFCSFAKLAVCTEMGWIMADQKLNCPPSDQPQASPGDQQQQQQQQEQPTVVGNGDGGPAEQAVFTRTPTMAPRLPQTARPTYALLPRNHPTNPPRRPTRPTRPQPNPTETEPPGDYLYPETYDDPFMEDTYREIPNGPVMSE